MYDSLKLCCVFFPHMGCTKNMLNAGSYQLIRRP